MIQEYLCEIILQNQGRKKCSIFLSFYLIQSKERRIANYNIVFVYNCFQSQLLLQGKVISLLKTTARSDLQFTSLYEGVGAAVPEQRQHPISPKTELCQDFDPVHFSPGQGRYVTQLSQIDLPFQPLGFNSEQRMEDIRYSQGSTVHTHQVPQPILPTDLQRSLSSPLASLPGTQ